MKSTPLLLNSLDDAGRRLVRLQSQKNDPKTEAWLQELLYNHPELLPVDDFDDLYGPAIPIGREVRTDRGPIDNLFVSPEGGITVVETKLWKNPEKHRTVVAQIIDYAKELATWDYDEFCEAILASSRKRGEEKASLEEKVAAGLAEAGVELHEFQENVAACLNEGNFLLLIVGDKVSPNIALLTKAIQSAPGLGFTLGLAEMQLYQMTLGSDWPLIVVPEVVGRTVEKTRGVVQVRYTQEKPKISVEVESDEIDSPSPSPHLTLESFLQSIPKDLVQPFEEGVNEWEAIGGKVQVTPRMVFFKMDVGGEDYRVIRCREYQITVIQRKFVEKIGSDPGLYDEYLESLESAPVIADAARSDKLWLKYDKLSGKDLRVLFRAGREFVEKMIDRE